MPRTRGYKDCSNMGSLGVSQQVGCQESRQLSILSALLVSLNHDLQQQVAATTSRTASVNASSDSQLGWLLATHPVSMQTHNISCATDPV